MLFHARPLAELAGLAAVAAATLAIVPTARPAAAADQQRPHQPGLCSRTDIAFYYGGYQAGLSKRSFDITLLARNPVGCRLPAHPSIEFENQLGKPVDVPVTHLGRKGTLNAHARRPVAHHDQLDGRRRGPEPGVRQPAPAADAGRRADQSRAAVLPRQEADLRQERHHRRGLADRARRRRGCLGVNRRTVADRLGHRLLHPRFQGQEPPSNPVRFKMAPAGSRAVGRFAGHVRGLSVVVAGLKTGHAVLRGSTPADQ